MTGHATKSNLVVAKPMVAKPVVAKPIVAIACDHAGWTLKEPLHAEIVKLGHRVIDLGTDSVDSVDYPDFAHALATAIIHGRAGLGILICGTGIGMGMTANRHPGIRAAVCHDRESARLARSHNDANVLAIGARMINTQTALDCLRCFLTTGFSGGRHEKRVAAIDIKH